MLINSNALSLIPKEDSRWYRKVSDLFEIFRRAVSEDHRAKLPTHLKRVCSVDFECHSIAVAVSIIFPELKAVHGIYCGVRHIEEKKMLNTCSHSWNVAPGGTIIDSYPVGVISGGPVIVISHGLYKDFGSGHYHQRPLQVVARALPMFSIWSRACLLVDVIEYARSQEFTPK